MTLRFSTLAVSFLCLYSSELIHKAMKLFIQLSEAFEAEATRSYQSSRLLPPVSYFTPLTPFRS